MNDQEGKKELVNLLHQGFKALKLYGKEAEHLTSIIQMFNLVLSDYPIEKIRKAFAYYLRHNSEMPTPADIAVIIERGNKPPFDKSVYISISKKNPDQRTSDEWEYMKEYENFIITGKN
jgi:hypothetical protein